MCARAVTEVPDVMKDHAQAVAGIRVVRVPPLRDVIRPERLDAQAETQDMTRRRSSRTRGTAAAAPNYNEDFAYMQYEQQQSIQKQHNYGSQGSLAVNVGGASAVAAAGMPNVKDQAHELPPPMPPKAAAQGSQMVTPYTATQAGQ